MQALAWGNLPILNEYKRLYPAEDPVKLHERLWHTKLIDPAGGIYVWDEQFQTMASTPFGHPAAPKEGPPFPQQLEGFVKAAFGVTFEEQGLRARRSWSARGGEGPVPVGAQGEAQSRRPGRDNPQSGGRRGGAVQLSGITQFDGGTALWGSLEGVAWAASFNWSGMGAFALGP